MNMERMEPGDDRPLPGEVQRLFLSYRQSMEIDASANFMPGLWARIDARRRVAHSFGRLAGAFVTASFLICLGLSGTLLSTSAQPLAAYTSYVDVLEDNIAEDDIEVQPMTVETI